MNLPAVIQQNAPAVLDEKRADLKKAIAQVRTLQGEIAVLETLIAVAGQEVD